MYLALLKRTLQGTADIRLLQCRNSHLGKNIRIHHHNKARNLPQGVGCGHYMCQRGRGCTTLICLWHSDSSRAVHRKLIGSPSLRCFPIKTKVVSRRSDLLVKFWRSGGDSILTRLRYSARGGRRRTKMCLLGELSQGQEHTW